MDIMSIVKDMPKTNKVKRVDGNRIDKIKTTISIRLGTKHRLLEIARKGESYDDVISRIVHANENLRLIVENDREMMKRSNFDNPNVMDIYQYDIGIGAIKLSDNSVIRFTYNKPLKNHYYEHYSMDVEITEVFHNNEFHNNKDIIFEDPDIYFYILEKIINLHFDPSFQVNENKQLIDPEYWRKVWDRIGLAAHSFDNDILKMLNKIMEARDG